MFWRQSGWRSSRGRSKPIASSGAKFVYSLDIPDAFTKATWLSFCAINFLTPLIEPELNVRPCVAENPPYRDYNSAHTSCFFTVIICWWGGGAWAVSLSSATCHVTARGPPCIYPLGSSSPWHFFLIEHHMYHFISLLSVWHYIYVIYYSCFTTFKTLPTL